MLGPITLGAIVTLLVVISALLVTVITVLVKKGHYRESQFGGMLKDIIDASFREENARLAKQYAEEFRLAKWIEELVQNGETDLVQIATEAEKRAYVMALKKAEDAVIEAEENLASIRREISEEQKTAVRYSKVPNMLKQSNETIVFLQEQEILGQNQVDNLRERLSNMTHIVVRDNIGSLPSE